MSMMQEKMYMDVDDVCAILGVSKTYAYSLNGVLDFYVDYGFTSSIYDDWFWKIFYEKGSKEINSVFGYRTSMSMKNKDTWEFAHKYCGKVWYVCGMVMLPITVIFMLLVIGKNEDCVGSIGGIICGVQLIPLIGSILPTEIVLKKNFDKNGTRR